SVILSLRTKTPDNVDNHLGVPVQTLGLATQIAARRDEATTTLRFSRSFREDCTARPKRKKLRVKIVIQLGVLWKVEISKSGASLAIMDIFTETSDSEDDLL
uniref:Uncharacterized protein n=1 Tax=Romanomermis culicivorax TaxID=13658 RepID=A0A915HQ59_ROMCU